MRCSRGCAGSRPNRPGAAIASAAGWVFDSFAEPYWLVFIQRLGELGFVEGRNLIIERLHAGGKPERLTALAAELANLECDVFFGSGHEVNLAALAQLAHLPKPAKPEQQDRKST